MTKMKEPALSLKPPSMGPVDSDATGILKYHPIEVARQLSIRAHDGAFVLGTSKVTNNSLDCLSMAGFGRVCESSNLRHTEGQVHSGVG